ncbi:MAG: hypothetical protein DCC71_06435 [Proteobacteria bacterium]|nr:MAG: hypothetical protein DCC71_06435 [Pseudomonadota bacterium]
MLVDGAVVRRLMLVSSIALLALPLAALAGDGRIEINQACVAAGCFAGDTPGFPVTLASPGAYVLTSNLTVPASDGVVATVAGVDLDLNGFQITGPGSCVATLGGDGKLTGVSCAGTTGTGVTGVTSIRDGTVRGFATGIDSPQGTVFRVERVTVRETSSDAIDASGVRLILTDSVISTNAGDGVSGQNSLSSFTVARCIFERNDQGLYLANGVASESVFVENTEALRSNVGGSGLVVNSSFFRNVTALGGGDARYRSNVFEDTTNALGGTNLGANVCNGAACP